MGFEKKRDFYVDQGWVESTLYERGNVGVTVRARDEKANQIEGAKRGYTCLKYIDIAVSSEE